MQFVAKTCEKNRRSTRVRAQIPLRVSSLDPVAQFSEHCHTLIINIRGCGVRLSRPLQPGVCVLLDELPTGHVMKAHVANCVPFGSEAKYWLVGLSFEHAENIWGIHPVPEDWNLGREVPHAAHAKDSSASKHQEWPYCLFSSRGEAHPGRR